MLRLPLALALFLSAPAPSQAQRSQAQSLCGAELADAEAHYTESRFDEALGAAARCLDREGLPESAALQALRLTVLAHLARGSGTEAQLAVLRLLALAPGYAPDPLFDPPPYVALVYEVQEAFGLRAPRPCRALLAEAEAHYVEARFGEALAAVAGCLGEREVSDTEAVGAHRLAAMAHLQQGDLAAAKREALALLAVAPGYAPDPMTDPPAYAALIGLARRQAAQNE